MSFSRNLKRIAGPGFHINVRYDDSQISKQQNAREVHANLNKDVRLPEIWDVKEQELLVTMDSSKQATYFDGYTHCFSVANNWPGTDSAKTLPELKQKILQDVKFVGVATTDFTPKRGYMEQGFVAQVGGVTTLINESEDNIYPGDKVMLDVNVGYARKVTREKGIPRGKVRFTVARALTTQEALDAALLGGDQPDTENLRKLAAKLKGNQKLLTKAILKLKKAKDATPEEKQKINTTIQALEAAIKKTRADQAAAGDGGKDDLLGILRRLKNINDRVIGKAYSFARPGDRLEVGLQPRSQF